MAAMTMLNLLSIKPSLMDTHTHSKIPELLVSQNPVTPVTGVTKAAEVKGVTGVTVISGISFSRKKRARVCVHCIRSPEMSLNLSPTVGPSGQPVLSLKAFVKPSPLATTPPTPESIPAAETPATTPRAPTPAWQWLRRHIRIIKNPAPAAIGAGAVIRERALAAGLDAVAVDVALHLWFRSQKYLQVSAAPDAMRCDADGAPVEPVTDEHRQYARSRLDWRKQRQQAQNDGDANG